MLMHYSELRYDRLICMYASMSEVFDQEVAGVCIRRSLTFTFNFAKTLTRLKWNLGVGDVLTRRFRATDLSANSIIHPACLA